MRRLRGPDGCPWDRKQTLETLRSYVLEETYEVLEAIDSGDSGALEEEIGDLLLEVVFLSQLCSEQGLFDITDVARGIKDKLVRRHPHVFGDKRAGDADEAIRHWEEIKNQERAAAAGPKKVSLLDGVPKELPALLRASRLSSKASATGFDWTDREQLFEKLMEELSEFRVAAEAGDSRSMTEELGDLLFITANIGRFSGIDPEMALQAANRKFISRFQHVESGLKEQGVRASEATLDQMEALWKEAKGLEKKG